MGFNGPFPAGEWSDIKIFRNQTRKHLGPGEKVLADLGYQGDEKVITKVDSAMPYTRMEWVVHEIGTKQLTVDYGHGVHLSSHFVTLVTNIIMFFEVWQ